MKCPQCLEENKYIYYGFKEILCTNMKCQFFDNEVYRSYYNSIPIEEPILLDEPIKSVPSGPPSMYSTGYSYPGIIPGCPPGMLP